MEVWEKPQRSYAHFYVFRISCGGDEEERCGILKSYFGKNIWQLTLKI